jgi:hypothetical protein
LRRDVRVIAEDDPELTWQREAGTTLNAKPAWRGTRAVSGSTWTQEVGAAAWSLLRNIFCALFRAGLRRLCVSAGEREDAAVRCLTIWAAPLELWARQAACAFW